MEAGAIPDVLDVFSVDIYAGFGNDTFAGSQEIINVSLFYNNELFPRMVPSQQAFVVPGFFGCTNFETCGSPKKQEHRLLEKLAAYEQFLNLEPRIIGLAPWHIDNRAGAGCDVFTKAKCNDCDMKLGVEAFPALMAKWQAYGANVTNQTS